MICVVCLNFFLARLSHKLCVKHCTREVIDVLMFDELMLNVIDLFCAHLLERPCVVKYTSVKKLTIKSSEYGQAKLPWVHFRFVGSAVCEMYVAVPSATA